MAARPRYPMIFSLRPVHSTTVMAGLDPAIHAMTTPQELLVPHVRDESARIVSAPSWHGSAAQGRR
jgi:hypothetical protein